jgi:hypothetical protein
MNDQRPGGSLYPPRRFLAALTITGLVVGGAIALHSVATPQPTAPVADSHDTSAQTVQELLARSQSLHDALASAQAQLAAREALAAARADGTAPAAGDAASRPTVPAPTHGPAGTGQPTPTDEAAEHSPAPTSAAAGPTAASTPTPTRHHDEGDDGQRGTWNSTSPTGRPHDD